MFFILRIFYIVDFRFKKEELLIKWNYYKNAEAFQNAKAFLYGLPDLEINFMNRTDLEINLSQIDDEFNYCSYIFYDNVFTLFISDTSTHYIYQNTSDEIINFWLEEEKIIVQSADSTFLIPKNFTVNYRGNLTSSNSQKAKEIFGLNIETINHIRDEFRKLNCFGYHRDYMGNIIIYFRTVSSSIILDVFSYLLILPENNGIDIDYFKSKNGRINNDFYWYHGEHLHINYFDYMKLNNRII
jgi:hypothetical protein